MVSSSCCCCAPVAMRSLAYRGTALRTYQRAVCACTGRATSAASRNRQSSRARATRVSTIDSAERASSGRAPRTASATRDTSRVTRALRSPEPAFSSRFRGSDRARSTNSSRSRASTVSPSRDTRDMPSAVVTPCTTATQASATTGRVSASGERRSVTTSTMWPSSGWVSSPTDVASTIRPNPAAANPRCGPRSSRTAARVRAGLAVGSSVRSGSVCSNSVVMPAPPSGRSRRLVRVPRACPRPRPGRRRGGPPGR